MHPSSFPRQLKGDWQLIYLGQCMITVKKTQHPKVFLLNLSAHRWYLNLHQMMRHRTMHKLPSAWQVSTITGTATTVGLQLQSQK